MLKFKEKLPPEIQVENVMSYTIQAAEVLKESPVTLNKWSYRFMLLPDGPHYYTGILQTMWYLLIDKFFSNKKNLIIFTDSSAKNTIHILDQDISYLGKSWKTQGTDTWDKRLDKKIIKKLKKRIKEQLTFIRVLNPQHEFSRALIWPNCSVKKLKETIHNNTFKDHNIIFIWALNSKIGNTKCMNKDKELISQLLLWEKISDYKKDFPHIYYFGKTTKDRLDNTEILAYLNSSQLGAEKNNCTGYACIIA